MSEEVKTDAGTYQVLEFIQEPKKNRIFMIVEIDPETGQLLTNGRVRFLGNAMAVIQDGPIAQSIPVEFDIEASTLKEAFEKFESEGERQRPAILRKITQSMQGPLIQPASVVPQGVIQLGR